MLQYDRIDVSQGIDINKTSESMLGMLRTLVINFNHMFVMVVVLCQ